MSLPVSFRIQQASSTEWTWTTRERRTQSRDSQAENHRAMVSVRSHFHFFQQRSMLTHDNISGKQTGGKGNLAAHWPGARKANRRRGTRQRALVPQR
eukprot:scaffold1378_cov137-Cylindrotheca_fusiformis.AAC.2